eukprot:jgi/Mesvir1/19561/Mv07033-RA.1
MAFVRSAFRAARGAARTAVGSLSRTPAVGHSNGVAGEFIRVAASQPSFAERWTREIHTPDGLFGARDYSVTTIGNSTNIKWHEGAVSRQERERILDQKGCVVWFTGLSGSGKSTVGYTLEHALASLGKLTYVLDGDNIRHGLNKNLGFTPADREENIRRIGEVSKLFSDAGVVTIVSFISPYRKDRDLVRALLKKGEFIEVYMRVPIDICEQRDPKGLYKLARAGKIKGFTGIDDPYEEPENPEVIIDATQPDGKHTPPEQMARKLLEYLEKNGKLTGQ